MERIVNVLDALSPAKVADLKQGRPVRLPSPELGGDVVIILAESAQSTSVALRDRLAELTAAADWQQSVEKARSTSLDDEPW